MGKRYGVNDPKPKLLQLFCRHKYNWYIANGSVILSGETRYKVCEKCGKIAERRFVPNFDE